MDQDKPLKVMLIDDDDDLHLFIARLVSDAGYAFCGARSGQEGLAIFDEEDPDLLLLDVMLPGMNGFDVCRAVREQGRRLPVIFLTAKGDIVDKSIGFKSGGDDYVVKPFIAEELMLRIEAHFRRQRDEFLAAGARDRGRTVRVGDLEVRLGQYEVLLRGRPVELTAKEFEIVELLAANQGQVLTRAQIYEHLWGEESAVEESSITVFMRKIREKIEDNPSKPRYLITVWRVGYKFIDRL